MNCGHIHRQTSECPESFNIMIKKRDTDNKKNTDLSKTINDSGMIQHKKTHNACLQIYFRL